MLVLLLAGCARSAGDPQAACIAQALRQPGLAHGVAAYTDSDGDLRTVSSGAWGKARLAVGYRYRAASLTKPRVAHAIRALEEQGVLRLDDTVATLLPELAFTGKGASAITVRELLQHTAGLGPRARDPFWYRQGDGPLADCAAAARYVVAQPVRTPPGRATAYSNAGYCLLAEILLKHPERVADTDLLAVLRTPYGGAGGWSATLSGIHDGLRATLPAHDLPAPEGTLPDGSWYAYGWRHWPTLEAGAPWTHTGRLEGMLAIALTDGSEQVLVAHFDGDPADYHAAAARFGKDAWSCLAR